MLLNTLSGCIILLLTNASLLYTSHLFVRRYLPTVPPSARLVANGILYYSFIILVFQALSPFYAISRTWVTVSCLTLAWASHFIWGKHKNIQADIEPIKLWLKDGLNSKWAALLIACGFVVLLSLSRALLMPPLAWDSLKYHLTSAALWTKKGTLFLFQAPDHIIDYGHLPINGELFASWLLLPFHNDLIVNSMNFPITLLGGIACYAIARELGMTRKEAGFAPALICFTPMIYPYITTEYVDSAVFTFCSASVLFTLRYFRKGHIPDYLLAFISAGILLGTKYTGISAVGLIVIAVIIKTLTLTGYNGLLKKVTLIILGFLILCTLGGRQYILNTIEAGNPLYPFPIKILDNDIFEGSSNLEPVNEYVSEYETMTGFDKFSWWEREYRKFCYLTRTPGPKLFLFLILALASLFSSPHAISKKSWYFLFIMWAVPLIFYYTNTSGDFAKKAHWIDESSRFLSPFLALLTIQGLFVVQRISKHLRCLDFFLVALIAWDLLQVRKTHIWEVEVLYPFVVLMIPLIIIVCNLTREKLKFFFSAAQNLLMPVKLSSLGGIFSKKSISYIMGLIVLVAGLYFLQSYRDNTRYLYYRKHIDIQNIPRAAVNVWELLDQAEKQWTIAMSMDWDPPGGKWLFYPLLGRWLQNDIVYISAKYKGEAPTWLHRGLLRGYDFSIWLYNLKIKKVDYIVLVSPWPIELKWMEDHEDQFQLVFSDEHCKVFEYTGEIIKDL